MSLIFKIALSIAILLNNGASFIVKHLPQKFGSFTTLNSTDRQVDFPTTYNNNLNKSVEVGTTSVASITTLSGLTSASSLSTVGTITSGTWNGSTITIPFGGTGSTTLSANQVLLGNGASQLNVVNGLGTSGQFLTSNGVGLPPTWQTGAIDQSPAGIYNFRGQVDSASSTINKLATGTLSATSTVTLSGVPYTFPSTQISGASTLTNNGSGILSWASPDWIEVGSTTVSAATSTVAAGGLPLRQYYHVEFRNAASASQIVWTLNTPITSESISYNNVTATSHTNQGNCDVEPATSVGAVDASINIQNMAGQRGISNYTATIDKGVGVAPEIIQGSCTWGSVYGKWDAILFTVVGGANFDAGTNITVWASKK